MKRSLQQASMTAHLSALAEPLRLRILRVLEKSELSVGEVGKVVQLPQSTVSRHLRVLSEAGWTTRRSEGTATLYRVVLDDLPDACRALWVAVREGLGSDRLAAELVEDERRLRSVLAERRLDSKAFFGQVAGQWDSVRNELFGIGFTQTALLRLINPNWVVADLGCGTGNAAELLAPHIRRVILVDQSEPMLAAARQRLEGVDNVEFRQGEFQRLPLQDAEVDAAVCMLVLHHVEDPAAACCEMRRILKTDGVVLIVDMQEHNRDSYRHTMGHRWLGFGQDRLSTALKGAGFKNVRYSLMPTAASGRGPGLFVCVGYADGAGGAE